MFFEEKKSIGSDSSIKCVHYDDYNCPLMMHEHFEIIYVMNGNIDIRLDNNTYEVKEGEMCLVMPHQVHAVNTHSHSSCDIVLLSIDYASEFASEYIGLAVDNPIIKCENNLDMISSLKCNKDNDYLVRAILNYVASVYIANSTFKVQNDKTLFFIQGITNYIDENFDKEPTIEGLASYLGYATHYVSSLLNKTFHKTFSMLVNERRIARAFVLLEDENKAIVEIAKECGFNAVRSFNRNFYQLTGITPSVYRENINHDIT